jgi:hypothetical protein
MEFFMNKKILFGLIILNLCATAQLFGLERLDFKPESELPELKSTTGLKVKIGERFGSIFFSATGVKRTNPSMQNYTMEPSKKRIKIINKEQYNDSITPETIQQNKEQAFREYREEVQEKQRESIARQKQEYEEESQNCNINPFITFNPKIITHTTYSIGLLATIDK